MNIPMLKVSFSLKTLKQVDRISPQADHFFAQYHQLEAWRKLPFHPFMLRKTIFVKLLELNVPVLPSCTKFIEPFMIKM